MQSTFSLTHTMRLIHARIVVCRFRGVIDLQDRCNTNGSAEFSGWRRLAFQSDGGAGALGYR